MGGLWHCYTHISHESRVHQHSSPAWRWSCSSTTVPPLKKCNYCDVLKRYPHKVFCANTRPCLVCFDMLWYAHLSNSFYAFMVSLKKENVIDESNIWDAAEAGASSARLRVFWGTQRVVASSLRALARTFCYRWSPSRASNCDWKSGTLWTPLRSGPDWGNAMKCMEEWISFGLVSKFAWTVQIFTLHWPTLYTVQLYALQCPKKAFCLRRSWRDKQSRFLKSLEQCPDLCRSFFPWALDRDKDPALRINQRNSLNSSEYQAIKSDEREWGL